MSLRVSLVLLVWACACLPASLGRAGTVITDGTLGPAETIQPVTTAAGPTYQIDASLGKQVGTNLFHSLSQFNLAAGDIAQFTALNPSGPITNVLVRVTGGQSTINGTIQSTITGANFYLMNPAGVIFGPNASLDISGSFAVTTANEIKLSDGTVFGPPGAGDAVLTTAPPAAFGFTSSSPPAITIGNTTGGPTLAVPAGNVLSVVGGAIQIVNGQIQAPGGRVNAVAAASTGQVTVDPSNPASAIDVSSISQFTDITMTSGASIVLDGPGGGMGVIRANNLTMTGSTISSATTGTTNGLGLDIALTGALTETGGIIYTVTQGSGSGGNISLSAASVSIDAQDAEYPNYDFGYGINVGSTSSGPSGNINATISGTLQVANLGEIAATAFGAGACGNVTITAGQTILEGGGAQPFTGIASNTFGASPTTNSGNVQLTTGSLQLLNSGQIDASTDGPGNAGNITVQATGDITINATGSSQGSPPTGITALSNGSPGGSGGTINITAASLEISNASLGSSDPISEIATDTTSPNGNAGSVQISVPSITLNGMDGGSIPSISVPITTGISSSAVTGTGNAGSVTINTQSLSISGGAEITAGTATSGAGGNVTVSAATINISDTDTTTPTSSINCQTSGTGAGGTVQVSATTALTLANGAEIDSQSTGSGAAGSVVINNTASISVSSGSSVNSDSIGSGSAGAVIVSAVHLNLANPDEISSVSADGGPSGTVDVQVASDVELDGTLGPQTLLSGPNYVIPSDLGVSEGGNLFMSFSSLNLVAGDTATFTGPSSIQNILVRVTGGPTTISGTLATTISGANLFLLNPSGITFGPSAALSLSGSFTVSTADDIRLGTSGVFATPTNPGTPATVLSSDSPSSFEFVSATPTGVSIIGAITSPASSTTVTVSPILTLSQGEVFSIISGPITLSSAEINVAGGRINAIAVASAGQVVVDPTSVTSTLNVSSIPTMADISLLQNTLINATGSAAQVSIRAANLTLGDSSISAPPAGMDVELTSAALSQVSSGSDVAVDGTLGPLEILTGPSFEIPASLGTLVGDNLFESFSRLDLAVGESVTFEAPTQQVTNLLIRVTGGASTILGTMTSDIPGANVFLIDPAGITFGPNATLSVPASFAVTTADDIRFSDGGIFSAPGNASTPASMLTSGSPVSFEFVSSSPNAVSITNSAIFGGESVTGPNAPSLAVGQGFVLSIISGPIQITGGSVQAPGGQINAIAVGSSGQVVLDATSISSSLDVSSISQFADINLSQGAEIDLDGPSGGLGEIQARNLTLNDANISSASDTGNGLGLNLSLSGAATLEGPSDVETSTTGSGNAGSISIIAASMTVDAEGDLRNPNIDNFGVHSESFGSGNTGSVTVNVSGQLEVMNGAAIAAVPFSTGNGENVSVTAGQTTLDGTSENGNPTGIISQNEDASASGSAGNIELTTGALQILAGGELSSSTFNAGSGGNITVNATAITINSTVSGVGPSNGFTGIASKSNAGASGPAGNIEVTATSLQMLNGGSEISTGTFTSGAGGSIQINVGNITIDEQGSSLFAGIDTDVDVGTATGNGGAINVAAQSIDLTGGGQIAVSTHGAGNGGNLLVTSGTITIDGTNAPTTADVFTSIHGDSFDTGAGGNVHVEATTISLVNGGRIAATAFGAGPAGSITIDNTSSLSIASGGLVTAATSSSGNAGNIIVNATDITVDSGGQNLTGIVSNNPGGTGSAGAITIQSSSLQLLGGNSEIATNTYDSAAGGAIGITATDLVINGQGNSAFCGITAGVESGAAGGGGNLQINSSNLQIQNGGQITVATNGPGNAGNIAIDATDMTLDAGSGQNLTAVVSNNPGGAGSAGSITIQANSLSILGGNSEIATNTFDSAVGGTIQINAPTLTVNGENSTALCGIDAGVGSGAAGNGGDLQITAVAIELTGGGEITVGTQGSGKGGTADVQATNLTLDDGGAISSSASAAGGGGDLAISASDVLLVGAGGTLSAGSSGSGNAGSIALNAGDLQVAGGTIVSSSSSTGVAGSVTASAPGGVTLNQGLISVSAAQSDGGQIQITSGNSILLQSSTISAAAAGNGGNITLTAPNIVELMGSEVTGHAGGEGGQIVIDPQFVILDQSVINGLAGGQDVLVTIDADVLLLSAGSEILTDRGSYTVDTSVVSSLAPLTGELSPPGAVLLDECGLKLGGLVSSFIVVGNGGTAPQPGGWLSMPDLQLPSPDAPESGDQPNP